ncbi:MFS transporter [Paenibacillus chibensis]|uniref:MFS transporter n=1 Tax=Paenibacillus chibensis TaxID=59846 RepID=UPI000FD992DE|nr:MFS transporter [Paenibacillus chibensis]MEC0372581.1 MFS transporter [Paenibacillus chibensis]
MNDSISKKNWLLIWILGMSGQICWNIENSWFNTFVYAKIAKDPAIISWMVAVSAIISTLATFVIGTWSDRAGKRKPFIAVGYILWGLFTIGFGATEFMPKNPFISAMVLVVAADAIMSFFGSTGYDAAFNPWTTDISNERNRGKLGGAFAAMPVLATIFGAIVSGMIVDKFDFFPFFAIMGGFVTLMGICSVFTLKDAPHLKAVRHEKGYLHQFASVFKLNTVIANQELFWVFVINAVFFIGFNIYFPYITIYFNNYLHMSYMTAGLLQGIGLVSAVCLTIPAAKLIDAGKPVRVVCMAIGSNVAGLVIIFFSTQIPLLLLGIFGAGVGYVLILQTLTAWFKNLYPEDQRGQFEGIKQVFGVCIPMVIGPLISYYIIQYGGIRMEIDGIMGTVPTPSLFLFAALITLFTFLPLIPASRLHRSRVHSAPLQPIHKEDLKL